MRRVWLASANQAHLWIASCMAGDLAQRCSERFPTVGVCLQVVSSHMARSGPWIAPGSWALDDQLGKGCRTGRMADDEVV